MLGGNGADMQRSVSNNRGLLSERKHLKELYTSLPHKGHHELADGKKMIPSELETFKQRLKAQKREVEIKMALLLITLVSAGVIILYFLFLKLGLIQETINQMFK